jgi:hypothetical protein
MHPNGQISAYEFAFGDVNPPVHAWAVWRVYKMTGPRGGRDRAFLESAFQKLFLNFTWWVNRKDIEGNNLFSGGFLGLDNIGVFDRSRPLPTGGFLQQADGTAWIISTLRFHFIRPTGVHFIQSPGVNDFRQPVELVGEVTGLRQPKPGQHLIGQPAHDHQVQGIHQLVGVRFHGVIEDMPAPIIGAFRSLGEPVQMTPSCS